MTAASRLPPWAQPREMLDLVRLAVPVAASRASFILMSLTDAVVLARYAPRELSFVMNAWLPNGVFMGFGLGLMMGVSVITAELNGSGKGAETGRIFRRGLILAVLFSVVATALTWLISPALFSILEFPPEQAGPMALTTQI